MKVFYFSFVRQVVLALIGWETILESILSDMSGEKWEGGQGKLCQRTGESLTLQEGTQGAGSALCCSYCYLSDQKSLRWHFYYY